MFKSLKISQNILYLNLSLLPFAFQSRSVPGDSRQLYAIFQFFIWRVVIGLLLVGNSSVWETCKDAAQSLEFLHNRESCLWSFFLLDLQFSTHGRCPSAGVSVSLPLLSWEFPGGKVLQPGEALPAGFQTLFISEQSHHFFSALSTVWNPPLSTQITKWMTLVQHPEFQNKSWTWAFVSPT